MSSRFSSAVIPGDAIGVEVTEAAMRVLDAVRPTGTIGVSEFQGALSTTSARKP